MVDYRESFIHHAHASYMIADQRLTSWTPCVTSLQLQIIGFPDLENQEKWIIRLQ